MKHLSVALICCFLLLSACASKPDAVSRLCPQTAILRSLDSVQDYGLEAVHDETSFVASSEMTDIFGLCRYQKDGVDVQFNVSFDFKKGARLGGDRVTFPLFVAAVSPDQKILKKEMMMVEGKFEKKALESTRTETFHVFLPLEDATQDASYYQILVGFQLTKDQLPKDLLR